MTDILVFFKIKLLNQVLDLKNVITTTFPANNIVTSSAGSISLSKYAAVMFVSLARKVSCFLPKRVTRPDSKRCLQVPGKRDYGAL